MRLNSMNLTWKAGLVDKFKGTPIGSSRPLLGVLPESKAVLELAIALGEVQRVEAIEGIEVPDTFDSATAWPRTPCARIDNAR